MEQLKLQIEETNIPAIIKFKSNTVLTSGSYQFNNIDEAKNSPLAQKLFYLPFIKRVYFAANFIALERFSIVEWKDVQDSVKEEIESFVNSGGTIINEERVGKKTPIEVYSEVTPNPNVLKFVANHMLVDFDIECKSISDANGVPLAQELFNFPFVNEIFISENYVSITKTEGLEWADITNEVRGFIKDYVANGKPISLRKKPNVDTHSEVKIEDLDEVSQRIISILDEYIRPAVASDGGNIMFKSYNEETQIVKVVLQGACSGCPSSTITLKNGIENMLKQLIPGKIEQVVAVNY